MAHGSKRQQSSFPEHGSSREQIRKALVDAKSGDANWEAGRLQSYVYAVGQDVVDVALDAYSMFYSTNALITDAFPSLRQLEDEIIGASADLLNASEPIGIVTTGGTESNLLAVFSARQWARKHRPDITLPEIVVPFSAHPSFDKAAHLFDMCVKRVPLTNDFTVDPASIESAITDETILLVVSAPSDTHGIVEPVPEIGRIAVENQILFHVDACVGGFFLPFLEQLEESSPIPSWDFRAEGVTSVSADLHKHGYTPKGASVLLYRTPELRTYNEFNFNHWPTGLYSTSTLGGTRSGGTVAAAWAVQNYLGQDGYRRIVSETMRVTRMMIEAIAEIPGLVIWGAPVMNKFGYGSHELDIFAVAEGMEQQGWSINLQQAPPGINMHLYPIHEATIEPYVRDLTTVTRAVARGEIVSSGREVRYN